MKIWKPISLWILIYAVSNLKEARVKISINGAVCWIKDGGRCKRIWPFVIVGMIFYCFSICHIFSLALTLHAPPCILCQLLLFTSCNITILHITYIKTLILNPSFRISGWKCHPVQILQSPFAPPLHTQWSPESPEKMQFHQHYKTYIPEVFSWASGKEGFKHDHTTYECTIRILVLQYWFPQMQNILAHMATALCTCSPGIFACCRIEPIYISVVNSYSRVCRMEEDIQTFEKMKKWIDGKAPVVVYNIILNGFGKSGQTENAFGFYEDMIRFRVLADAYTFRLKFPGDCMLFFN